MKIAICIIVLTFGAAAPNQGHRRQLQYEPEKVILTGKVVLRTFFGPPNYGENPKTDSKEQQYILILESPIDVVGNADYETERRVKEITLVIHDFKATPERSFLRRHVRVEGTLFHAITGHHHTRVLITVSSIQRAKRGERL